LLQRTRAVSVVPVYEKLVRDYPTPADLAELNESQIARLIAPLGLKWRAPLIKKLATDLSQRENVPKGYDVLRELPAIGDYAASAYLSFHGKKRAVIIDANVVRWICRFTGAPYDGETRRKPWVRAYADALTPKRAYQAYNYAILDFTMQICKARPICSQCPFAYQCKFSLKAGVAS